MSDNTIDDYLDTLQSIIFSIPLPPGVKTKVTLVSECLQSPEFICAVDDINNGRYPNRIVGKGKNTVMEMRDLLDRNGWLSDNIINSFMDILQERSPNDTFLGPHFLNLWIHRDKNECKPQTELKNGTIFIPVNMENTHWSLVTIRFPQKRVLYYDSCAAEKGKRGNRVRWHVMDWLGWQYKNTSGGSHSTERNGLVSMSPTSPHRRMVMTVECLPWRTPCTSRETLGSISRAQICPS